MKHGMGAAHQWQVNRFSVLLSETFISFPLLPPTVPLSSEPSVFSPSNDTRIPQNTGPICCRQLTLAANPLIWMPLPERPKWDSCQVEDGTLICINLSGTIIGILSASLDPEMTSRHRWIEGVRVICTPGKPQQPPVMFTSFHGLTESKLLRFRYNSLRQFPVVGCGEPTQRIQYSCMQVWRFTSLACPFILTWVLVKR